MCSWARSWSWWWGEATGRGRGVAALLGALALSLLPAVVLPAGVGSASPRPKSVGEAEESVEWIRRIYAQVNDDIRAGKARESVFVTDDNGYTQRRWKLWVSRGAAVPARKGPIVATVYAIDGSPAKAVFVLESPSGDWTNTTEYYFYRDGKTALRFERHFTFLGPDVDKKGHPASGPYVIERRRYFDEQGRVVRNLERAFTRDTGQEMRLEQVQHVDLEVYPNVSQLP